MDDILFGGMISAAFIIGILIGVYIASSRGGESDR